MQLINEDYVQKIFESDVDKYSKMFPAYVTAFENTYKKINGRDPSIELKNAYVKGLYSFYEAFASKGIDVKKYVMEDVTTPDEIGAFIHYGFDIITALYVQTVLDDIVSVQAMDKKIGEIFYMDFVIGQNKGIYKAGDPYLSAKYGPRAGLKGAYSGDYVDRELVGIGNGSLTDFEKTTLEYLPLKINSNNIVEFNFTINNVVYSVFWDGVNVYGDGITFVDNIALVNSGRGIRIEFNNAPVDGTNVYVSYNYDSTAVESPDFSGVPSIEMRVTSKWIEAERRALKTKYMLDNIGILSKHHGIDFENEMLKATVSGVLNEIQVEIAYDLWKNATAGSVIYDRTLMPVGGYPILYRPEAVKAVTDASTLIEQATRRVRGSFVIAGTLFCNEVRMLPRDIFDGNDTAGETPVGMHKIGTLNGKIGVYQNLDFADDIFVVGAKGKGMLYAGYVYAPFIPVMTSKPYTNEDLVTTRTLLTYYGKDFVNSNFYCKGRVKIA